MNPMNEYGGINNNNLNYQQIWAIFQQKQQQQKQEMMINQLFIQYQQFCHTNGLNPNDQSSFSLFYQQLMNNNGPQEPYVQPSFPPQPQPQSIYPPQQPFKPNIPGGGVNDGDVYVHEGDQMKELIPRGEQTLKVETRPNEMLSSKILNITFRASSGLNVVLIVPQNITVKELFERYMNKIQLPLTHLGKDLKFIYNGTIVDPFSTDYVGKVFRNNIIIQVYS